MATYRSYTEKITAGLRWAKAYFGLRFTGTIALHCDLIAEGVNEAIKARSAKISHVDAYPYIGGNTNIERYPNDTDATYKDRLLHPFSIWAQAGTKQGLERALDYFGFPSAVVYEDKDWPTRPPKPYWSQFWIFFPNGTHTVAISTTVYGGAAGNYGAGLLYGVSGITAQQVEGLRRLVRKWKASRSICREFIFETGGITYGTGHTYGDGSVYGGSQATIGAE